MTILGLATFLVGLIMLILAWKLNDDTIKLSGECRELLDDAKKLHEETIELASRGEL